MDTAQQAVELCKKLERSQKLPQNCVVEGNLLDLPYSTGSAEAIFCNFSLQHIPLLPDIEWGMNTAWQEMHRVLKPGGYALLGLPYAERSGRVYGLFTEVLSLDDFRQLAESQGFEVLSLQTRDITQEHPANVRACVPWHLMYTMNALVRKKPQ
jgi:SAM-dependent methyltransferase